MRKLVRRFGAFLSIGGDLVGKSVRSKPLRGLPSGQLELAKMVSTTSRGGSAMQSFARRMQRYRSLLEVESMKIARVPKN